MQQQALLSLCSSPFLHDAWHDRAASACCRQLRPIASSRTAATSCRMDCCARRSGPMVVASHMCMRSCVMRARSTCHAGHAIRCICAVSSSTCTTLDRKRRPGALVTNPCSASARTMPSTCPGLTGAAFRTGSMAFAPVSRHSSMRIVPSSCGGSRSPIQPARLAGLR